MTPGEAPRNKQNRSNEELEMRAVIVPELRRRWPGARIVHEFPLRYSENRIDIAAICEDKIISVEVKSSRDVADRLEQQLSAFLPVSWLVIAALAPKWNEKLPVREEAFRGGVAYVQQRTACQEVINRIRNSCYGLETWTVGTEPDAIEATDTAYSFNATPWTSRMLDMLWVEELRAIADRHRIGYAKRPNHTDLKAACFELMTGREVVRTVCAALRGRAAFAEGSDPPVPRQEIKVPYNTELVPLL